MTDLDERKNIKAATILTAGHLTVDSYGGFITPLLSFIALKLDVSIGVISLIISISHLLSSTMQPVFGYISDSLSKRFFIFWGLILAAVFMSLTGLVPNVYLLCLAIVLGNIGVAFYHPQSMSLVSYFAGTSINTVMGVFTACGTVGYAIGPLISSLMVSKFGLESTIFAVFPGLIFAIILLIMLPKIPQKSKKTSKAKFFSVFKIVLKDKLLSMLMFTAILNAIIVLTFVVWMPFLWQKQGLTVNTIGITISIFSFLGGFSSVFGAKFASVVGRRLTYYISFLPIMPLGLACVYFSSRVPLISLISFVLIGFFIAFCLSVNIVMAQKALPEHRAMISGIIGGLSWGIVGILLTPLGFIAEKIGIASVLSIIAAIPLISSLFLKIIPEGISE